jgi:hypothetical protein
LEWSWRIKDEVRLGTEEVKSGVRVEISLKNRLRQRVKIGNGVG